MVASASPAHCASAGLALLCGVWLLAKSGVGKRSALVAPSALRAGPLAGLRPWTPCGPLRGAALAGTGFPHSCSRWSLAGCRCASALSLRSRGPPGGASLGCLKRRRYKGNWY